MERKALGKMFKLLFPVVALTAASGLSAMTGFVQARAEDIVLSRDVMTDLSLIPEFDSEDFPIETGLDYLQSFEGMFLLEYDEFVFFYVFNRDAKELPIVSGTSRFTMATSVDLTDYEHYSLSLLSFSSDRRFYKYLVDDFAPLSGSSRQYDVSEIEFMFDGNFRSGKIAQRYTWTTSEEGEDTYTRQDLATVTLHPTYDYYRCSGLNSHSVLNYDAFTDVAYVTFALKTDLGDLIGVHLSWNEQVETIGPTGESTFADITPNNIDYSSTDYQPILGYLSDMNAFETVLGYLNPAGWYWGYSETADVPVIEKLSYPYDEEKYLLSDATGHYLRQGYLGDLLAGNQRYVLRFALGELVKHTYTYHSPTLDMDVILTESIKTNFLDIDVLDLTFVKDGIVYTLGAVSDPGNIRPSPVPPPPDGWLELVLSILGLVLVGVIVYFIVFKVVIPTIDIFTRLKQARAMKHGKRN